MEDLLYRGMLDNIREQNNVASKAAHTLNIPVSVAQIVESYLFVHEDLAKAIMYHKHEVVIGKHKNYKLHFFRDKDVCGACEATMFSVWVTDSNKCTVHNTSLFGITDLWNWLLGDADATIRIATSLFQTINRQPTNPSRAFKKLRDKVLAWRSND